MVFLLGLSVCVGLSRDYQTGEAKMPRVSLRGALLDRSLIGTDLGHLRLSVLSILAMEVQIITEALKAIELVLTVLNLSGFVKCFVGNFVTPVIA